MREKTVRGIQVGTAVIQFERGEMRFDLVRRRDGYVWLHQGKPFGPLLAAPATAIQFLRGLCSIYNCNPQLPSRPPD